MNTTPNHGTSDTLNYFAEISYMIKSSVDEQELIDQFLDHINEVDEIIRKKTKGLETINDCLQRLTWVENAMDQENLVKIDGALSMCKGLLAYLQKEEKEFKNKLSKFCSGTLELYYEQIDLLEETLQDVYDIFFVLPSDPEFVNLNKRLQEEI